jgi:hypothetical protein
MHPVALTTDMIINTAGEEKKHSDDRWLTFSKQKCEI